ENRRLALLVKQSSDAIMIYDLQGNITFWNPAAERLFGYTAAQVDGKSATLLTAPGRVAEIAQNLESVAHRELIENLETERVTSDGRVLDVALSAAPLIDPHDERVIGQICSMRDITENKRAQQTARELEENRKLTQLIQSHVEEERRHLARELHDELGQCVIAIKTIGYSIANRSKDNAADIHENAQTIVSVASHIYDVMHGIIRDLRPSGLDHLGLLETLSDTVNTWRERHPEIKFEVCLQGKLDDLGETINITLYRLVQECLTNLVRHAAASKAEISLSRADGSVKLLVADNGKGIGDGEAKNGHFGLIGMRERVHALNGSFETESRPGAGLRVIVVLPLERAA
ncbi:MAG: PAS domain S-box protein, partial [Burkholderiales bacterium]|nr:PAS domain S-box protein [Burkholderiales bacterium]